jgi:hypothetical protein
MGTTRLRPSWKSPLDLESEEGLPSESASARSPGRRSWGVLPHATSPSRPANFSRRDVTRKRSRRTEGKNPTRGAHWREFSDLFAAEPYPFVLPRSHRRLFLQPFGTLSDCPRAPRRFSRGDPAPRFLLQLLTHLFHRYTRCLLSSMGSQVTDLDEESLDRQKVLLQRMQ